MANELLEIRFHGGGINPSAVKASEIAGLILAFEKSIIATVHEDHPDLDTDSYAFLSFESIKDQSLALGFNPNQAKEAYSDSHLRVAKSINENDYNDLPFIAIENLQVFSKFAKKHNCTCDYIYQSEVVAAITPASVIDIDKNLAIKGETTIYGKIERVGGAKPRITFKDHTDNNIYFEVTEQLAKRLANKLYEEIGLTGIATWDRKSYRVIDFKINDIIDLNNNSLLETFTQIHEIFSQHWEQFDDIETTLIADE